MPYTVNIPNTKDELRATWRSNRAWLIPTLLLIGSWVYFLRPRTSVADTAKYQKLEVEKRILEAGYGRQTKRGDSLQIIADYATNHSDTLKQLTIKYEKGNPYPVTVPILPDEYLTNYLKRHFSDSSTSGTYPFGIGR